MLDFSLLFNTLIKLYTIRKKTLMFYLFQYFTNVSAKLLA